MTAVERFLRGYGVVELVSASKEHCLNRLSDAGIPFWSVTVVDGFTLRIQVFYRDIGKIQAVIAASQAESRVLQSEPGIWFFRSWKKRPVLLLALVLAVFAVLQCPKYIWTVQVSGNETIPSSEILRAVSILGVHFGARTDSFRSQDIKNQLLNSVDGLQWAAVNCSGGVCQVLVKEREKIPDILDRKRIADVVADRPGTIVEMSVLEGQALCQVGDTVAAGQVLVSGTTDFVVNLLTAHAEAEIYALTWRDLQVKTPDTCLQMTEITHTSVAKYLQFGGTRIKISGSSRICTAGCDKMIERKTLTLPGGISFPVTLITETCTVKTTVQRKVTRQEAAFLLQQYGWDQTEQEMTAGKILSVRQQVSPEQGAYLLAGTYACREMIAREQEVDFFGSENDGRTNSERGTD